MSWLQGWSVSWRSASVHIVLKSHCQEVPVDSRPCQVKLLGKNWKRFIGSIHNTDDHWRSGSEINIFHRWMNVQSYQVRTRREKKLQMQRWIISSKRRINEEKRYLRCLRFFKYQVSESWAKQREEMLAAAPQNKVNNITSVCLPDSNNLSHWSISHHH